MYSLVPDPVWLIWEIRYTGSGTRLAYVALMLVITCENGPDVEEAIWQTKDARHQDPAHVQSVVSLLSLSEY
jgi:hypothetical protein